MRHLVVTAATLCAMASPAFAGPEEAVQKAAAADKAAAAGDNTAALALYKEALSLHDAPRYRCNVGIAYYKVKDWPRAHLFLAMCLAHTAELDAAAVAQMGRAYAFVEKQLRAGAFAEIRIDTTPPAVVTVSAFADDESFPAPRTVWLPRGPHTLHARADGYLDADQPIDVTGPAKVTIALTARPVEEPRTLTPVDTKTEDKPPVDIAPPKLQPDPPVDNPPPARASRTPAYISFAVGGAALVTGLVFHKLALDDKSDAEALPPGDDFDAADSSFRKKRYVAIGCYAGAAIATAAGVYLFTRSSKPSESATVGVLLAPGGAGVTAGWRF